MKNVSTILLVEDDPKDVLLIKRAFDKAGISNPVQVIDNGDDAIDYLSGRGRFEDPGIYPFPALLLLDLKLPRKSGLEVLEWIRQQPQLRYLPTVILTSSENNEDIKQAYESGANSYLVKSADMNTLVEMMQAVSSDWRTNISTLKTGYDNAT